MEVLASCKKISMLFLLASSVLDLDTGSDFTSDYTRFLIRETKVCTIFTCFFLFLYAISLSDFAS